MLMPLMWIFATKREKKTNKWNKCILSTVSLTALQPIFQLTLQFLSMHFDNGLIDGLVQIDNFGNISHWTHMKATSEIRPMVVFLRYLYLCFMSYEHWNSRMCDINPYNAHGPRLKLARQKHSRMWSWARVCVVRNWPRWIIFMKASDKCIIIGDTSHWTYMKAASEMRPMVVFLR